MMPIGLLLSGGLVSLSEIFVPREIALSIPFIIAAIGVSILSLATWRPLGRGFRNAVPTKKEITRNR